MDKGVYSDTDQRKLKTETPLRINLGQNRKTRCCVLLVEMEIRTDEASETPRLNDVGCWHMFCFGLIQKH
jgi:hypothetical protein